LKLLQLYGLVHWQYCARISRRVETINIIWASRRAGCRPESQEGLKLMRAP